MNCKNKLKAFTLIEIIVVMLLTAIIMGIVFSAFFTVQNQYKKVKDNDGELASLARFEFLMQMDFFKAKKIAVENQSVLFENEDLKLVEYKIEDDLIIRQFDVLKDTFRIKVDNLKAQFLSKEVNPGLIDELDLDVVFMGNEISLGYKKEYASDMLMEEGKGEKK